MNDNDYDTYIGRHTFHCCECGRHIVRFGYVEPRDKCGLCVHMPGWFRDPDLSKALDPDYDPSEHVTHDPVTTCIEPPS